MLPFSQVDVFTATLTCGNPVAVVHDADRLTPEQMAAFARWTNLVESTFLLKPTPPDADYRLRIFTPQRELPFAGHPTLGSARAWLAAGGEPQLAGEPVQQCDLGLVRIRRTGDRLAFAAPPLTRGGPVAAADLEVIVGALGLQIGDVIDATWADNGPGWVALLLADADMVLSLEPDRAAFGPFTTVGVVGPHPRGGPVDFEVRAFIPATGIGEDPVTGSLNAAIGQWLIGSGRAPRSYVAAQGTRLHRHGRVHVEQVDGDVWVGGDTVLGITGRVAL